MKYRVTIQIKCLNLIVYNDLRLNWRSGNLTTLRHCSRWPRGATWLSAIHAWDSADAIHFATADKASSKIRQGRWSLEVAACLVQEFPTQWARVRRTPRALHQVHIATEFSRPRAAARQLHSAAACCDHLAAPTRLAPCAPQSVDPHRTARPSPRLNMRAFVVHLHAPPR